MSVKVLLFIFAGLVILGLHLIKVPSWARLNNSRLGGFDEVDALNRDMNTNPASLRNPNRTIE